MQHPGTSARRDAAGIRTTDQRELVRVGLALVAIYVAYALLYPDRAERAARHAFNWVSVPALLGLFWYGARCVQRADARAEGHGGLLWTVFLLACAAAVFIRPFQSTDVHAYVNVGWLQAQHGLNPYVHVPADLPDQGADPMLAGQWAHTPCTYGFLFALICRGVVEVGGGDPALTVALFKALNVAVLALIAVLLQGTLRRTLGAVGMLPLFLLLWNPYVVLHFVANGHNDLWMALGILLACRWALAGRWLGVVPALVAGVLVKHVAAVLLPFALVYLVRRHGWRRALVGCALGAALAAAAALPYAADWRAFQWERIGELLTSSWNSFQAVIRHLHGFLANAFPSLAASQDAVTAGVRVLFALAYLAWYGRRCLRALRRAAYGARDLIEDGLVALFVLLCVASSAWHPWYLGMFLPAVFLLPTGHWVRTLTIWLTGFQMLYFTGVGKARVLEALLTLALPMALYWWRHVRAPRPSTPAT